MGANSSNANNQILTLEAVLEEAEEVLRKATEIVSQTIQHEFTELQNYEEKAATTASNTIKTINQKLAELSEFSEKARLCIAKKEAELQGVELKMKNTLADCYRKQYGALEKFRTERLMIHEEAKQMKFDTQRIIQNCISSDDQLKCFELGIKDVRKRMLTLYEKFQTLAKKETEARVKCTKLIHDCDKKAMESGHKKYMEIIDEIRKCIN
ncbi:uncharacterized protein LOC112494085 isoform X2 [Cephus cinctus]|uniref:Uncharacterized protein LOC112494085 isoform X2 n=1 Tax=Cephus cinctus TaxID=211228 RepID=A0AAJ7W003_CEPCN|nr:uncharacterized protein LOC112494085 isoform X2 [Cephus cinctus]XP_024939008.1 uncharacterized protein LOC112494085 isoform X2 [Cephus cinctus]XP_024939009.1 uncharacterized protein LOC112494085 isoform X2 [Cephus cinctus]